jgi:hypothetical protein
MLMVVMVGRLLQHEEEALEQSASQKQTLFIINFWGSPPPPRPSIFFRLFLSVHHLVNQDDWHLLAHAMCNGL